MSRYKVAIELRSVFEIEIYAGSKEDAEYRAETYLHQEEPHLDYAVEGFHTTERLDEK